MSRPGPELSVHADRGGLSLRGIAASMCRKIRTGATLSCCFPRGGNAGEPPPPKAHGLDHMVRRFRVGPRSKCVIDFTGSRDYVGDTGAEAEVARHAGECLYHHRAYGNAVAQALRL